MKKILPFLFVAAIPVGAALFLVADRAEQKTLSPEASISISQQHAYSATEKGKTAARGDSRIRIDAVAPPMMFTSLDGRAQTLVPRGELSFVMLADTTCPCVRAYDTRVKALAKSFPDLKITYVFSSPLESKAQVQKFVAAHGYKWPVAHDAKQQLLGALDGKCTTESFLFDTSGTLRYHGRIDDNIYEETKVKSRDLENAIHAIISGKPIEKPEISAFGCVIPRAAKTKNTHKGHSA